MGSFYLKYTVSLKLFDVMPEMTSFYESNIGDINYWNCISTLCGQFWKGVIERIKCSLFNNRKTLIGYYFSPYLSLYPWTNLKRGREENCYGGKVSQDVLFVSFRKEFWNQYDLKSLFKAHDH